MWRGLLSFVALTGCAAFPTPESRPPSPKPTPEPGFTCPTTQGCEPPAPVPLTPGEVTLQVTADAGTLDVVLSNGTPEALLLASGPQGGSLVYEVRNDDGTWRRAWPADDPDRLVPFTLRPGGWTSARLRIPARVGTGAARFRLGGPGPEVVSNAFIGPVPTEAEPITRSPPWPAWLIDGRFLHALRWEPDREPPRATWLQQAIEQRVDRAGWLTTHYLFARLEPLAHRQYLAAVFAQPDPVQWRAILTWGDRWLLGETAAAIRDLAGPPR